MERSSFVLSILAMVLAVAAVVLALLLPGPQGPQGQEGPAGAQGPQGPVWTPSVEKLEWTIGPNWDRQETIYLDEGDILEGSVMGKADLYKWSLDIWDMVEWDLVRWYPADISIDFRYVAQTSGKHEIWVFNEQDVTADVILVYWIIKS